MSRICSFEMEHYDIPYANRLGSWRKGCTDHAIIRSRLYLRFFRIKEVKRPCVDYQPIVQILLVFHFWESL